MVEFVSLFAGVGGFDLGFERAGMTCACQVEIDARCNEVLAHRWPDVRRYGDVRDVGKHNLGSVDLICGGFPCQGLSVAGCRAGLADERSGLWWEFARIIEELRPRWIVIENVPGLRSSWSPTEPPPRGLPTGARWEVEETSDLGTVLATLAELGYGWAYRSLDAQYDNVAQQRERVFIVGCLGDRTSAAKVLFESESLCWDSAPRRKKGEKVARPVAASTTVNHCDESQQTYIVAFDWQSGGDVRLNISKKHTSALQASQTPAVQNRYGVRRLTPTECERLQGFPDRHTAVNGMKDTPRYRMLGNAVCVPVAEWIGRRILAVADDR